MSSSNPCTGRVTQRLAQVTCESADSKADGRRDGPSSAGPTASVVDYAKVEEEARNKDS